jgi:hypothetical protein
MKKHFLIVILTSIFSCKSEEICTCTDEYNQVCAGDNQYRNPCFAKCDGYKDSEITVLLSQEEIDTGILIDVGCSL